jgi:cyclic-di-AMP phosphodiesterase PgpH
MTTLFPRYGKFRYSFEIGRPWKYETLIAPFDFGILKSKEDLDTERVNIQNTFLPYYRLDSVAEYNAKKAFADALAVRFQNQRELTIPKIEHIKDSAKTLALGIGIINNIYDKGIINTTKEHYENGLSEIYVFYEPAQAERKRVDNFYTLQSAFAEIQDEIADSKTKYAEVLLPMLQEALKYNITFDETTTDRLLQNSLETISLNQGGVVEGEKIISEGEIVTQDNFQVLVSLKQAESTRTLTQDKRTMITLGNFLLTIIVLSVFMISMRSFAHDVFISNQKLMFTLLLMLLMVGLVSTLVKTQLNILYAIPFCIVPIILRTFFGSRVAMYAHACLVLLCGFIVPLGIEYTFMQFMAGMIAIFTTIRAYYWSQFFISNAYILFTYLLAYVATSLIQNGSVHEIELGNVGMLGLNVLLTLMAYPLIPVFEKLFGFVSEITLLELSDINKPLLKQLSLKAPGTFNHSLSVANIAEAAANEIGANAMLVKVGALYHDIGKMDNPEYFIENQHADINPHDDLPYEESAQIIISHVKKGVEHAKKHKLPDILVDFIRTHHGTTRVEYFWQNYIKNYPDQENKEEHFRYPGPLPYSKETAILMMADSCEAASRSLKNPTNDDIEQLVERLINNKIDQTQFVNADITFKEISQVKKVIKKMLNSMYHVRIAYPTSK